MRSIFSISLALTVLNFIIPSQIFNHIKTNIRKLNQADFSLILLKGFIQYGVFNSRFSVFVMVFRIHNRF